MGELAFMGDCCACGHHSVNLKPPVLLCCNHRDDGNDGWGGRRGREAPVHPMAGTCVVEKRNAETEPRFLPKMLSEVITLKSYRCLLHRSPKLAPALEFSVP